MTDEKTHESITQQNKLTQTQTQAQTQTQTQTDIWSTSFRNRIIILMISRCSWTIAEPSIEMAAEMQCICKGKILPTINWNISSILENHIIHKNSQLPVILNGSKYKILKFILNRITQFYQFLWEIKTKKSCKHEPRKLPTWTPIFRSHFQILSSYHMSDWVHVHKTQGVHFPPKTVMKTITSHI